ncbi:D-glycero-alpha-D-manno-heptose 1-phosphate guanylyltransferase [compost metagenome]
MVKEHFGDGSQWGIEIRYLHETQALGTAGALSLLPEVPTLPIIVMNGDLLTKVNYRQLLDFHAEQHADATMCIREYKFQVPYGVVKTNRYQLLGIDEKPEQRFFVSAGIYVFSSQVLEHVIPGEVLNMPAYFQGLVEQRYHVTTFPIREYWLDIGQMDDFKRAHGDYLDVFK